MAYGTADLVIVPAANNEWDAFCDDWVPYAEARRLKSKSWDWHEFDWHVIIPASNFQKAAALDPNGQLEGLIAIDPSRLPNILVVQWLQTSPRNHGATGKRRGVGTMLLRWAVQESEKLGMGGALTLTSTKKSEQFYDKLGFCHVKTFNGQKVYELPASGVANFRNVATLKGVGAP